MLSAYLLVSHGSRDPRPGIAMQQIAKMVSTKIDIPPEDAEKLVATAYLELQPQPLHIQICEFANSVLKLGREQQAASREDVILPLTGEISVEEALANPKVNLKILPLFLLSGVHVMEDIPLELELAEKKLGANIHKIDLLPYLGTYPNFRELFTNQETPGDATILMAHGSRRPGFSKDIEIVASRLNATACYWAVPPNLETTVQQLVDTGKRQIKIIPYFLFAGGITDAIANHVEALKLQFPGISLHLAEPLGASEDLANLIWDLLQQ
ncbi:sirohydrochlorin chelatase [Calothrix sp. PCC 6303]|uniref:sirohydrochlorin chelatase n=1 Tax=Calothrix sp. PCC 6303 TaxID=1170562 RepID=UPI0002A00B74|nr:sirohydrochlorin chelatase [Calothrix sp. PCC 6303]AFZ02607.1 cobalamin (vitamin B12) biosynthesis CbiX protein [Calothrix sp. PCC 6303]